MVKYNKVGDVMKVEKFKFKGEEINLPVFDEDEIETNDIIDDELDKTSDLEKVVKEVNNNE